MKEKNNTTSYQHAIAKREKDFTQWYQDVIEAADLAEHGPVKGSMVIKPHGYAIWEHIQSLLDKRLKESGVSNAYFPLFIPESFLKKEKGHVEGFSPELAVVTHAGGEELEEKLVVRPTSETIMYHMYAKWIHSWRDLPLRLNQWCNVVRWEKRPRLFVRTTEFLWQEGHTAHASKEECEEEAKMRLEMYKNFCQSELALPVYAGMKTEAEKFAGADHTYTIEVMTQDGKALQAATSHNLGQNFASVFDIQYTNTNGKSHFVWQTSFGLSTRIIGAVIMTHGDNSGIILPPRIAPIQVIIIPIFGNSEKKEEILSVARRMETNLTGYRVKIDDRDNLSPGAKFHEWEKKGVCLRIELGPEELEKNQFLIVRRDTGEKYRIEHSGLIMEVDSQLREMQQDLYQRALRFRDDHTFEVNSWEQFCDMMKENKGFAFAHFCMEPSCEAIIKEETKATTRCIPPMEGAIWGNCFRCGKHSKQRIYFAKAY
jgi:prolyl-tRNA synthetase